MYGHGGRLINIIRESQKKREEKRREERKGMRGVDCLKQQKKYYYTNTNTNKR